MPKVCKGGVCRIVPAKKKAAPAKKGNQPNVRQVSPEEGRLINQRVDAAIAQQQAARAGNTPQQGQQYGTPYDIPEPPLIGRPQPWWQQGNYIPSNGQGISGPLGPLANMVSPQQNNNNVADIQRWITQQQMTPINQQSSDVGDPYSYLYGPIGQALNGNNDQRSSLDKYIPPAIQGPILRALSSWLGSSNQPSGAVPQQQGGTQGQPYNDPRAQQQTGGSNPLGLGGGGSAIPQGQTLNAAGKQPGWFTRQLFGESPQVFNISRFTPDQQKTLNYLLRYGVGNLHNNQFDFAPIGNQALEQFYTQTIPSLAERFTSMGNGQRSSAFQGALGNAGRFLGNDLAAQQQGYNLQQQGNLQNLIQLGLSPQFESSVSPGTGGALGGLTKIGTELGKAYVSGWTPFGASKTAAGAAKTAAGV